MAKTVKKSASGSLKRAKSNGNLAVEINKVISLHKVWINWFDRCPYCGDGGSHFLVPHHGEYWQCLVCNKKGTEIPVLLAKVKYEF